MSPRVAEGLRALHYDVEHVGELGLGDAPDETILAYAERESRVVVSADTDFGELLARSGEPRPSVLLWRARERRAGAQTAGLHAALTEHHGSLRQGAIVVIDAARARVRRLPIA